MGQIRPSPLGSVQGHTQSSRSDQIPLTLPCQQPLGTGSGHFDEAKDHLGGNRATSFVMHPSTEREPQGSGELVGAALAAQLLAYFKNTAGEQRAPIAMIFHSDHPPSAFW